MKGSGARGRVWLDVTTSRHAGSMHDGTTRVERGLIRELPAVLGERLGYCVYDRMRGRFSTVGRPALPNHSAPVRVRGTRGGAARAFGRRVERSARLALRAAAARGADLASRLRERDLFPGAERGDVLLLAGENWSRYDFEVLRRLGAARGVRIAAILQDMIPHVHPQFFDSAAFVERFRGYAQFLAEDADVVLAISDSTRDDFAAFAPKAAGKVARIELGADFAVAASTSRPAALGEPGDGRPFVLAVSTMQSRKNYDLLYRLWQRFAVTGIADHPHLVVAGRPGFGCGDLLWMMRNDPSISGSVTLLHNASDAELNWLYDHCLFSLYPSWYEGWGLPLSESLAHGKVFIASDRSSLPEAGQGLGIHLDPYDLPAWEREILALARDDERRAAMEGRIVAERRLTGWADCARSIAAALDAVPGGKD